MIGGLQGDFGDLDIKYLKQNISKCRSYILGSFRRTPRHCAKWLRNSPGKRYRQIQICLTREVETPSFPIRRQAPDVKYPEKMERHKGDRPRVHGVGTHPEQLHSDSPRGYAAHSPIYTPSGRSTRHSRTSHTRTIAYPIRICCLDHCLKCTSLGTSFRQPATAHVPPPSDGVSELLWQRTSKLRLFMFLSFPLLCHGFQRTLLNLGLLW